MVMAIPSEELREIPRSEVEVAADAVWALFACEMLPKKPQLIARAAMAAGIPVGALRDADGRRRAHVTHRPVLASVPAPTTPKQPNTGPATAARVAAKNPEPGLRRCSFCEQVKPFADFGVKDRPSGRLKSMCKPCEKAYQRERYLTVQKVKALNAVGLTFVVSASDDVDGVACIDCLQPIRPGQEVHGSTSLHHVSCPAPPPERRAQP
jgi:hypothetical protein